MSARSWPGPKARAAEKERKRLREILKCNGCGRGFYAGLSFDTEPPAGAPTGICQPCQG